MATALLSVAWAQNSGTVTVFPYTPNPSRVQIAYWSVLSGNATGQVSNQRAPDAAPLMEFTMTTNGGLQVQNNLAVLLDLRPYDSFSFWIRSGATGIGDFTYLVDSAGNRRWFTLNLVAEWGWQQPHYFINAFIGQDSNFDISSVVAVRFAQVGMPRGNKILASAVRFETGSVNHADAPSAWHIDIGSGTLLASPDAVSGFSVQAQLKANQWGQADIATGRVKTGITWNFSQKNYLSFYYKDSAVNVSHYCLIYDSNYCYRQWIFDNRPFAGQWAKIVVELEDSSYVTVCPSGPPSLDLSNIIYFETGVFNGIPGGNYTFYVDEVSVH